MAIKRHVDKSRSAISEDEGAWLRGDRNCGFVQFKHDEELQELWDRHGHHEAFFWEPVCIARSGLMWKPLRKNTHLVASA
jgi:hypothetical protein